MIEKQVIAVDFSKGIYRNLDSYLMGINAYLFATQNMVMRYGVLERSPGMVNHIAGSITGTPIMIQKSKWTSGTEYVWVLSDTKLNQRSGTTWSTYPAGNLTGSEDQRASNCYAYTVALGDLLLIANLGYNVQKYNGSTLADLGGLTTVKSATIANFMSHIVLGNTNEAGTASPWRVKWSNISTPETWTGGTSGQLDLIDTDDFITKLRTLYNRLFIYREKTIWELVYVGSPSYFRAVPLFSAVGTKAPDSLAEVTGITGREGNNLFFGNDNVYLFDSRSLTAVGDQVAAALYGGSAIVNVNYLKRIQGYYDRTFKLYFLAIPTGVNTYPDTIFALDLQSGSWWGPIVPGIPIRCFGQDVNTGQTWNATNPLVGTWSQQSVTWLGTAVPRDVTLIGSAANSTILKLDPFTYQVGGSTPTAYIETGDMIPGTVTRWVRFYAEMNGTGGGTLMYSTDGGNSWKVLATVTGTGVGWLGLSWHFNFSSEKVRFRLTLADNVSKVRRMQIWYKRRAF